MNGKEKLKFHHVQGGAYILRKEAYSQCGGFNPLIPQNHMDVEYSYYLESMEWKLGEISDWISITKKTYPKIYAYLDEYTTFVHPSNLKYLKTINSQAVNNCNICKGKIIRDICDFCGSDSSERTIYRILSGSNKIHRSKKCTLLLKHNSNLKQYEKLFEITNKKYSTSNITENLEEILKNIEQTDILITNTNFDEQNCKEILKTIIEKLTENGLLIIQMSYGKILNNKIKKFLKDKEFKIKTIEF
ncbi:MAG: hypothetical protein Q8M06_09560, partial [Methanobacteriaceae archaeon]|nr:hypothetical protein [Methanobacteriaceae archaeon]